VAALAVVLLAAGAQAQSPATTPESVAREYFAAMRAADWQRAARLMHPDALGEFKGFFRALAATDSASELLGAFFGVRTAAELDALPPGEVYARMLGSMARLSPEMRDAMSTLQADVVGQVPEGPGTAHVVYRMRVGVQDVSVSKVEVLSLRRSGGGWLALLTGDLQGMMQSLSRAAPRP
jgi:hypothetical protein